MGEQQEHFSGSQGSNILALCNILEAIDLKKCNSTQLLGMLNLFDHLAEQVRDEIFDRESQM